MIAEIANATRRFFGRGGKAKEHRAVDPVIVEVVKPEPVRELAELVHDMLCDPMAVMTLGVFLANVKRADVTIAIENADTDTKAAAIQEDIERLWLDTLEKLCDLRNGVFTWGGLPFELVEENAVIDGVPITRIKEFKQLPKVVGRERATERLTDSEGKFAGIRVTINGEDFVIPAEQSAWLAIGATPLEPHGQSVFIGAPQSVRKRRKETDQNIDVFIRQWALRGPTIHAPAVAEDKDGNIVDNLARVAEQVALARSGAGLILPNDAHQSPGMDGRFAIDVTHDVSALDAEPLKIIDGLIDAKMSRAFGVHESVTMDSETGSYASQSVRMFVVLSKCDGHVSQLTTQFRDIIERAYLPKNYAGSLPKLTIRPVSLITDGLLTELVKTILEMPQWGPLLQSGAVDVATILQGSGIPVAPDVVERIGSLLKKVNQQQDQQPDDASDDPAGDDEEGEAGGKAVGSHDGTIVNDGDGKSKPT